MNNLHRELAPVTEAAWRDLEDQVRDTFVLNAGARRVVDMPEPKGPTLAAVGTGHFTDTSSTLDGVQARVRESQPVVELRAVFRVSREAIDSVERGAGDPDWAPAIAAAEQMALAEDHVIFNGMSSPSTAGVRSGSSNDSLTLPGDVSEVAPAVAKARTVLRLAAVGGPYALLVGSDLYTEISGLIVGGHPAIEVLSRIVDGDVLRTPALQGCQLVSSRGGDYLLTLGRDLSIGYLGHDASSVELYLEESFAFQVFTPEASVALTH